MAEWPVITHTHLHRFLGNWIWASILAPSPAHPGPAYLEVLKICCCLFSLGFKITTTHLGKKSECNLGDWEKHWAQG